MLRLVPSSWTPHPRPLRLRHRSPCSPLGSAPDWLHWLPGVVLVLSHRPCLRRQRCLRTVMRGIFYHEQYRVATDRNGARVGRTGGSRKIPRKAGKQPETSLPTGVSESIPESITETTSFVSDEFKAVMGRFATGVTVVTTRLGAMRAGITVNAFCSVSLDPPLVLICIDRASRVHDLLIQAGIFAVNLLTTRQEEVARCFAGQADRRWQEFCGCVTHIVATGAPVFDESLGFVDCHITDVFAGGDHSIILGQVEALGTSEGEPLLYYRSHYGAPQRLERSDA